MIEAAIDISLADRMACKHAISEARVAYWWRQSEVEAEKRRGHVNALPDTGACGCCGRPLAAPKATTDNPSPRPAEFCRTCGRAPMQAQWAPYGASSQ